eukprot:CAMPEP_0172571748 /NCGR_PEP_ID=MMETSP1067-20121228/132391_1 /TAXON_ID=265564 ORGANISM="Thalassiosira punctigera, Strain Tpunct2005C2" /NCGR_SAMPLE_ID=MMETSP1067 /ASSEMBLY_ACC=CAM_ASM_000444 /LENGTH=190 /DNA_ID=CAMNT_0013364149 /DNA_START=84 /DNA_END=656 /DNA_ORIENTATION=+
MLTPTIDEDILNKWAETISSFSPAFCHQCMNSPLLTRTKRTKKFFVSTIDRSDPSILLSKNDRAAASTHNEHRNEDDIASGDGAVLGTLSCVGGMFSAPGAISSRRDRNARTSSSTPRIAAMALRVDTIPCWRSAPYRALRSRWDICGHSMRTGEEGISLPVRGILLSLLLLESILRLGKEGYAMQGAGR